MSRFLKRKGPWKRCACSCGQSLYFHSGPCRSLLLENCETLCYGCGFSVRPSPSTPYINMFQSASRTFTFFLHAALSAKAPIRPSSLYRLAFPPSSLWQPSEVCPQHSTENDSSQQAQEPLHMEICRGNGRPKNACQDLTRATLCGNLKEKCRAPEWAPWWSTGLCSYRKKPSVWAHCGRNFQVQHQKQISPPARTTTITKKKYKDFPARDPRQCVGQREDNVW